MSNRSRSSPASNPFARAPAAADNPFASDDDEVLEEEEDEADVMARESVRMVQERLKAEQKSAAATGKKHVVKHTAPSFSDDEDDDGEVVEDDDEAEEEDTAKRKWVPDAASPFARNVPAAGKPAATKLKATSAKASKAAASNPFAEHSKGDSKQAGGGVGKAKGGKKEAAADTNPFADPEPSSSEESGEQCCRCGPVVLVLRYQGCESGVEDRICRNVFPEEGSGCSRSSSGSSEDHHSTGETDQRSRGSCVTRGDPDLRLCARSLLPQAAGEQSIR